MMKTGKPAATKTAAAKPTTQPTRKASLARRQPRRPSK